MTQDTVASIRPQPLIALADVQLASTWYQRVLGATSGHGGPEYEQLLVDGSLVLQLHRSDVEHHHGRAGVSERPTGDGVALWFEAEDFAGATGRIRELDPEIVTDVHTNPNARHQEIWIRDLDGYLVVIAER